MNQADTAGAPRIEWGLVIHGGVGVLAKEEMTAELETAYLRTLTESLQAGFDALGAGGNAADAVVEAIGVMEDSPIFNAGRGSNFTADGVVSMDASIMVGNTLEAGAVAGVTDVRYPIRLARHVMEDCPHVMLAGSGAEAFARTVGMESTPAEFFFTQRRWDDLQSAKAREAQGREAPNTVDMEDLGAMMAGAEPSAPAPETRGEGPGGSPAPGTRGEGPGQAPASDTREEAPPSTAPPERPSSDDDVRGNSGTVGAVALDAGGLLVAGTSTGGSANKKWGRIGDSPVISAGTYAGSHCGVSCTGWGEYFIRHAVAHDIQARMAYLGLSLREATHQVVMEKLERHRRGLGGVVALDREGHVEMCFNTQGMYRGWVDQNGEIRVAIW